MANANPNRLGQINLAGDPDALFLKVYSGLTMEAFDRESAFRNRHMVRTIPFGKSAQFPASGLANVRYHTPGSEIVGSTIPVAERVILVEDMLISDVFIAAIDELKNHYDLRSIFAHQQGQAMAKFYDQNVARAIINAARANAAVTGLPNGYQITDADLATDGNKLYAAVFNSGVQLDANDVPNSGRWAGFKPVQYALIVRSEKPINRDVNPEGNGSIASGFVGRINDIPLFKTNNLATADDRTNAQMPSSRQHDYSPTVGLVFHEGAAGTVQLQDMTFEMIDDRRRQGTLLLGKYLTGHDKLRAEAAVELRTAAPAG